MRGIRRGATALVRGATLRSRSARPRRTCLATEVAYLGHHGPMVSVGQARAMATSDVPVPSLGDSITEGTLVEWTKGVGEYCNADDIVAVVETDKVSVDIRSPQAGTVVSLSVGVDDTVLVGQVLLTLDSEGEPSAATLPPAETTEDAEKESVEKAAESPAAAQAAQPPPAANFAPPQAAAATQMREPRIKFRHGKRTEIEAAQRATREELFVAPEIETSSAHLTDDEEFLSLPVMFARLPVTEKEMLLVELGGAED